MKKILGLKSHDYHVFMECLLPVAFCGFLPKNVWLCLAKLSYFYRQLCARQITKNDALALEQNIVVLVCKLEKIFPPGFFNPMQHLMVHLAEEVRLGGPIQYRWMYPIERYIFKLQVHLVAGLLVVVLIYYFFLRVYKSLNKKFVTRQEFRVALLKLSLLRRPQILCLFSLNRRCIQLETRHLDMMMGPQHLCLLVILKSFDNLVDAGAKGVVTIFLQKNTRLPSYTY